MPLVTGICQPIAAGNTWFKKKQQQKENVSYAQVHYSTDYWKVRHPAKSRFQAHSRH